IPQDLLNPVHDEVISILSELTLDAMLRCCVNAATYSKRATGETLAFPPQVFRRFIDFCNDERWKIMSTRPIVSVFRFVNFSSLNFRRDEPDEDNLTAWKETLEVGVSPASMFRFMHKDERRYLVDPDM